MKKVVVSNKKYDYAEFDCVNSVYKIDWENTECLIFNSAKESEVDIVLEIAKGVQYVEKLIYINQDIDPLFYSMFAGVNGDVYDDVAMLGDEDTLLFLVEDYKNTGMTIKPPIVDMETISKFVDVVSKEGIETLATLLQNNLWIKTLETSLKGVETALVRTDSANSNMVALLNKTSEVIDGLKLSQQETTDKIEKLSAYVSEVQQKTEGKTQNNMFYFNTFTVPIVVPKVLYIKVYSPCRYLLSFISAYQHYLKQNKQINSKILVAVPKLKQLQRKYDSFARLATETLNVRDIHRSEIFVTNEPKPQILSAFFNMTSDLHIVIDMLYGDDLLAGPKVVQFNAINGMSDCKTFNIKPSTCIISQVGSTDTLIIPHLKNYNQGTINGTGVKTPASLATKRTKYFDSCKDSAYKRLNTALNV